jgi:hypothetical protein
MPIFFFHIRHGGSLAEDPDGTDLPTLALAYAEAVAMARELAAADLRANKPARNLSIEITDAVGQIQTRLSVRAIINNTALTFEGTQAHATEYDELPHMINKEQHLLAETRTAYSQNRAVTQKTTKLIEANRAIFLEIQSITNNIIQEIAAARRTLQGS